MEKGPEAKDLPNSPILINERVGALLQLTGFFVNCVLSALLTVFFQGEFFGSLDFVFLGDIAEPFANGAF